MIDRLLGRAALKDRIDQLETELDERESELAECQERLEAAEQRRADAVSDKQAAQRQVNKLQDRIADLEGTVERLREDGQETLSFARREDLRDGRRGAILDRLQSVEAGDEGAFTAYVDGTHDLPDAVREAFGDRAALVDRAAPCLAVTDDAGLVGACLSVPDRPEPFTTWDSVFTFERSWFEPRGHYTLALVRSDLFAMGEYRGDERTAFQGFDSDLKSQHSKGGFSQARFERLRDEQIDDHVERCRVALEERTTDRLYVVGERTILDSFEGMADATATVDATGDPEDALDRAFRDFWTVRLRVL